MALNFRRFLQGLQLVGQNSNSPTVAGEMRFNSSTSKIEVYNVSAIDPLVSESLAAVVLNKTLGSTNTATGIKMASFTPDGSATLTAPVATDTLVARNTTDTLTNKSVALSTNTISTSSNSVVITNVSGVAVPLTAGTNGQVLTVSSGAPVWATPSSSPTSSYELYNLGLSASVGSNALTINLKQSDGSTDPASGAGAVKIGFRSSTAANGNYNERSVTGALSIIVPSGAFLGLRDGIDSYVWVYALDNAGSVELAVSNIRIDEGSLQTSTTISSSATVSGTIYSGTGRSSVPFRLLGRLTVNQTSGHWTSVPSEISLATAIYPTEIVSVKYKDVSNGTSISSQTTVAYQTIVYDTHNAYGTVSGNYTVPIAGTYQITGTVIIQATTFTIGNPITVHIQKNGTDDTLCFIRATGNSDFQVIYHATLKCALGDTIRIQAEAGGTGPTLENASGYNYLSITKIN